MTQIEGERSYTLAEEEEEEEEEEETQRRSSARSQRPPCQYATGHAAANASAPL